MTRHIATHDSAADGRLFLTATEVGHQLGLQKSRVYALAAEGLIPTVRLGRRIWFPRRASRCSPRQPSNERERSALRRLNASSDR